MKSIMCPVCGRQVEVRSAKGRKSGKPFLMLICSKDGRHLRAFITDQKFVQRVLEAQSAAPAV